MKRDVDGVRTKGEETGDLPHGEIRAVAERDEFSVAIVLRRDRG